MELRSGKVLNNKNQRIPTQIKYRNRLSKNTTLSSILNNKTRGYPKIMQCHARKCQTCHRLSNSNTVRSNFNGRTFSLNLKHDVT